MKVFCNGKMDCMHGRSKRRVIALTKVRGTDQSLCPERIHSAGRAQQCLHGCSTLAASLLVLASDGQVFRIACACLLCLAEAHTDSVGAASGVVPDVTHTEQS